MSPASIIHQDPIAIGMLAKELRNQRIGGEHNLSFREKAANHSHGRCGHDRIAQPIGGTDQNSLDSVGLNRLQGESPYPVDVKASASA